MVSLNQVQLFGRAGRDAELRYLANGTGKAEFSLATDRNWKDKAGEWQTETEWHNCVVWGEAAERLSVEKGAEVLVTGRISTRTWKDDQGVAHYRTEVIADRVIVPGQKPHSAAAIEADSGGDLPWE